MPQYTHGAHLHAKFHLHLFLVSPLRGKQHQSLPHFQHQHSMMVPPSSTETRLNVGAQLQTFPQSNTIKIISLLLRGVCVCGQKIGSV